MAGTKTSDGANVPNADWNDDRLQLNGNDPGIPGDDLGARLAVGVMGLQIFDWRYMILERHGTCMNKEILQKRTKSFALAIILLTKEFPRSREADVISRQIIRSGTSVAANYRAACRSRSKAEFIAKLGTVAEEADESLFWLEMVAEAGILTVQIVNPLLREADELTAIMVASRKSAQKNH